MPAAAACTPSELSSNTRQPPRATASRRAASGGTPPKSVMRRCQARVQRHGVGQGAVAIEQVSVEVA